MVLSDLWQLLNKIIIGVLFFFLFSCDGQKKECEIINVNEIIFLDFNQNDTSNISVFKLDEKKNKYLINGKFSLKNNALHYHFDKNEKVSNVDEITVDFDTISVRIDSIEVGNIPLSTMFNTDYECGIVTYKINNCRIKRKNKLEILKKYIDSSTFYNYWTEKEMDI